MTVRARKTIGWYAAIGCWIAAAAAFIPLPHQGHTKIGSALFVVGVAAMIIGERGIKNEPS